MTHEPALLTLLLLAGMPLGLVLTRDLLPARSRIARLGTATLAGLAVLAAAAHALLCLGVPGRIGIPAVAGLGVALGATALVVFRRRGERAAGLSLLAEILPLLAIPVLLATPYDDARRVAVNEHDAIHIWMPKAVRVLDEAPPDLVDEFVHDHPEYPRGLAIFTAAVAAPAGQIDPRLPRMVPLFLFALLLLCVYDALSARGNLAGAVTAIVILGCLPLTLRHATSGLVDLPLGGFIALGCIGLAPQRDGRSAPWIALAGGLGALVLKDEGLVFCGALLLVLVIDLLRSGRARAALAAVLVTGALAAPWLILRSGPRTGSPLLLGGAFQNLGLVLIRFDMTIRELLHLAMGFPDPSPGGFSLPDVVPGGDSVVQAAILCALVLLIGRRSRFPVLPVCLLLLADLLVILMTPVVIEWQLVTAANRLVLQALPALLLAAVDKLTMPDEAAVAGSARTPVLS